MPNFSRQVVVTNSAGLHARPVMQFVDTANSFHSSVVVEKIGTEQLKVDGKSVLEMFSLVGTPGTVLVIHADGDDAEAAVGKLADLFVNKFGEEP